MGVRVSPGVPNIMNCLNCNKVTENPKFCSRSCSVSYNNKGRIKNPRNPDNYCSKCGKRKKQTIEFCRACTEPTFDKVSYRRAFQMKRYNKRKESFIEKLGGKCSQCGSDKELQFDHINPEEKSFTLGHKMASAPLEVLEKELEKCQLLCRGCHIIKTVYERYGKVFKPCALEA